MKKDKKPLNDTALRDLREKVRQEPELAKDLFENFERTLASQGYVVSEEFLNRLINEEKKTLEKIPIKSRRISRKVQFNRPIRIKIKINREKKSREMKYM